MSRLSGNISGRISAGKTKYLYDFPNNYLLEINSSTLCLSGSFPDLRGRSLNAGWIIPNILVKYVSFYNTTTSTWTLATPRTTWKSSLWYFWNPCFCEGLGYLVSSGCLNKAWFGGFKASSWVLGVSILWVLQICLRLIKIRISGGPSKISAWASCWCKPVKIF